MKIKELHKYHGAALTQIIEHSSFKAINRVSNKYGHYSINDKTRVFIKYRSGEEGPWNFQFSPEELRSIKKDLSARHIVFICLVCGDLTICAIDQDQINALIKLDTKELQNITVEARAGGSLWVKGNLGKLKNSIPHNSFPAKLFPA